MPALQERTGFVYDADTLEKLQEFPFTTLRNEGASCAAPMMLRALLATPSSHPHLPTHSSTRQPTHTPHIAARAGWGITHDGTSLIVSDGSSTLHFWDPATRAETRRVRVHDPATGAAQPALNELEYVHGWVFANVWQTNTVLVIDPATGRVAARWDFSELSRRVSNPGRDVLNGLAYSTLPGLPGSPGVPADAGGTAPWSGRLWVTGKRWNTIFELALDDPVDAGDGAGWPATRSGEPVAGPDRRQRRRRAEGGAPRP